MEHSELMRIFLAYTVENIPRDDLKNIVRELTGNALVNMGHDESGTVLANMVDGIVALLKNKYKMMPLSKVIAAFDQGSLGELGGTTRFTMRNVNIWVKAIYEQWGAEYLRAESRRNRLEYSKDEKSDPDVVVACRMKIMWRLSGRITHEQSDKIHVEDMVQKLKDGFEEKDIIPEMFLANELQL